MKSPFMRWLLTTLAATALQAATGMVLVGDRVGPPPGTPATLLAWSLLANGLTAGLLLGLAVRSRWVGRRSMGALFALAFGIGYLANLVEAVVFDVLPLAIGVRVLVAGALSSAGLCAIVAGTTRADCRPDDKEAVDGAAPVPAWWRFAAVAVLYLVLYFTAGALVFPFVAHFYQTVTLPPVGVVALLQLLVRGPFFGALIYLMVRFLIGRRGVKALWSGAAMAILGGIGPLLVPSAMFPDEVRWAHFVEVGVSNSVFGAAASWILSGVARHGRG